MSEPRFTHDCDGCVFLGQINDIEGLKPADVYYCQQCDGGTLVLRWADDGGDYSSQPTSDLTEDRFERWVKMKWRTGLAYKRALEMLDATK